MRKGRKGWPDLSENYRKRLQRAGISEQSYNAGASLKAARGHATPTAIGEKRYSFLLGLAKQLNWTEGTSKDAVDDELRRGTDPRWLRDRLKQRIADTQAYKGPKNPGPGRQHYMRRRQSVSVELYWYH